RGARAWGWAWRSWPTSPAPWAATSPCRTPTPGWRRRSASPWWRRRPDPRRSLAHEGRRPLVRAGPLVAVHDRPAVHPLESVDEDRAPRGAAAQVRPSRVYRVVDEPVVAGVVGGHGRVAGT